MSFALDEDNENTLKIFGGIDEENGDVILRYANQTKYPDKEIRVKQLIVQAWQNTSSRPCNTGLYDKSGKDVF